MCKDNYTVRYESCHNYYRTPTKWEKLKLSVRASLNAVFVLPFCWIYKSIRCLGCGMKCKKEVEIINLQSTISFLNDRVQELEMQNSIFRQHQEKLWQEELFNQKKKAAGKRPSSKKKRRST